MSHPVGVVPALSIPGDLPLENGQIACLTCHDDAPNAHQFAMQHHDAMLRPAAAAGNLCAVCHTSDRLRDMHSRIGKAHILGPQRIGKPRPPLAAASRVMRTAASGLDEESQTCLSCHDGTIASGITLGDDGIPGVHAGSHPVGVPYVDGAMPGGGGYGQLRAASALDGRIRLFSGQVGCGSCHSPYSQEHKQLVMSNFRSALCLNCHQDR